MSRLRLSDLLPERLILPADSMSLRALLEAGMARSGLRLAPVVEANEVEVMKGLAVLGQGVTLLSRLNIQREQQDGALVFVPIADRALAPQTLRLFGAERPAQPALTGLFADALAGVVREMLAEAAAGSGSVTTTPGG